MAAPSDVAPRPGPQPAESAGLATRRLGWVGLALAVAAFLVGLFAGAVLGLGWAGARGLDQAEAKEDLGFALLSAAGLWVGFLGLPLAWSRRRGGAGPLLGLRARWVDLPLGLAVGLGSAAVAALVSSNALSPSEQQDLEDKARSTVDRAQGLGPAILLVVALCVLTPLAEEVFFRGLLFRSLHRVAGLAFALPLGGVVFGLVHYDGASVPAAVLAVQLGLLTLFGMALCGLAHRTDRLGAAIVAHAAFNAVTVVTLLLTP